MKKALILLSCWMLLVTGSVPAQDEKKLLLVPLEMRGKYLPVEEQEVSQALKQNLEAREPGLKVSIASERPLIVGPTDAVRIGKAAGVDFVLYGDINFRRDENALQLTGGAPEGYPEGGMRQGGSTRYMVTVAAVAHGRLVDVATGKLLVERPALLMENEYTGAARGGRAMEELEEKLAHHCVRELTQHLIEGMSAALKR